MALQYLFNSTIRKVSSTNIALGYSPLKATEDKSEKKKLGLKAQSDKIAQKDKQQKKSS